jgi:hypothetical protein
VHIILNLNKNNFFPVPQSPTQIGFVGKKKGGAEYVMLGLVGPFKGRTKFLWIFGQKLKKTKICIRIRV